MEDKDKLIKEIAEWFYIGTVTLLDKVLGDDLEDPQFSAETTLGRIKLWLSFKKEFYGEDIDTDAFEWMIQSGYTEEDVELFKWMIDDEHNKFKDMWKK